MAVLEDHTVLPANLHTNHTCLYSPVAEHHPPLAGTHCACPQRDGKAQLTRVTEIGCLHRELNRGPITHPSTNRARRRVTSQQLHVRTDPLVVISM